MSRDETDPGAHEVEADGDGVVVARTASDGEADLVRQILASHGIPSRVAYDVGRPWPVRVAEARVLVPPAFRTEAARLLAEHRRQGLRVLDGGGGDGEAGDGPGRNERRRGDGKR